MTEIKQDIFDNYLQQIKYIEEYRKNFKCNYCKAPLSSSTCIYCKSKQDNEEIVKTIAEIEHQLQGIITTLPVEVKINETLNYLYLLKDFSCVSAYIDKISYYEKLEKEKEFLYNKMLEQEKLDEIDSKNLEFIYCNIVSINEKEDFCLHVIKTGLAKRAAFSPIFLENVFIDFMYFRLKEKKLTNVIPSIEELSDDRSGLSETHHIISSGVTIEREFLKIDRNQIRLFLDNDFSVLETIFHEIRHFEQKQILKDVDNPNIMYYLALKDYLISHYDEIYYQNNYLNLLFELDAEFYGLCCAIETIKKLGFYISIEGLQSIEKDKREIVERSKKRSRNFMGEDIDLEFAFDNFILHRPELLEQWSYLKYEYTVEGDLTRRLNKNEILALYNTFDNSNLSQEKQLQCSQFFSYLYQRAPSSINNKLIQ